MRAMLMLRVALVAPLVAVGGAAMGADLSLRRVMLSSAGVGYFEYEASVDQPSELGLDVKLDQVDDVLKSLVVFDGLGGVGAVSLPGRDDRNRAFGQVPFDSAGLASPLAFLNSLQGFEIIVEGPRPMQGRLLRAEGVREPAAIAGHEGPLRTRVTLLTDAGLKQFVLEESDAVQVADPALRARIARAIASSRHETAQDTRHLTVTSPGTGARTVRVGYVAAAPLWKASYRVVLPKGDADPSTATARLQGWATLENNSDTDWSGISLALQYGNPVTFHQAIYRSYFVTRPEVPVEVMGRLLPDVDVRSRPSGMARAAAPPPPPSPARPLAVPSPVMAGKVAAEPQADQLTLAEVADGISVREGTTETVFALPGRIDVAAGRSASVPILDVIVPATRVALAQPGQAHPLAAIRIDNKSAFSLPAGVLTLYDLDSDAPYAGDARLGGLPAGESRLVPYAQDLRTGLEWTHEEVTTLSALSVAEGTVSTIERERTVTHVVVTAPGKEGRRVLIEVPKVEGGTVAAGFAQPVEETGTAWRFLAALRPGETTTLSYAIDRNEEQSYALLEDAEALTTVMGLQGLSPAGRAALQKIVELRARESALTTEQERLVKQREMVDSDEARLRSNLTALQPGDALRTRLLRLLDADETRRGQIDGAVESATAAVARAHQVLSDAIGALKL